MIARCDQVSGVITARCDQVFSVMTARYDQVLGVYAASRSVQGELMIVENKTVTVLTVPPVHQADEYVILSSPASSLSHSTSFVPPRALH